MRNAQNWYEKGPKPKLSPFITIQRDRTTVTIQRDQDPGPRPPVNFFLIYQNFLSKQIFDLNLLLRVFFFGYFKLNFRGNAKWQKIQIKHYFILEIIAKK